MAAILQAEGVSGDFRSFKVKSAFLFGYSPSCTARPAYAREREGRLSFSR
uniref:Uncharacterized protein n=1 Tax=Anguilla anguilla TaxID=7936 RepID=A0A0E9XM04_ANGAN